MSDAPVRKIGGLSPRAGSDAPLSRLVKANRAPESVEAPIEATAQVPVAPAPGEASSARRTASPGTRTPRKSPKARQRVSESIPGPKATMTVYVENDVRDRSRAVFRATQHLEDDASYSDMISKAILAEVLRREGLYNEGEPFTGGHNRLPTGRPMSD
jgi:hypothetical protein